MADARRLCRALLLAYPAAYRVQRGDEIVSTILDVTPPGRLPRLADQLDVVADGLRRRLGTARLTGLDGGLRLAAPVALALAAGISAFVWWRVEPVTPGTWVAGTPLFGVFRSLGPVAYASWILAVVGWAGLRATPGRALIGGALGVTLLVPAAAPLTTVDRPPLWVVMALGAFGLLALLGTAPAVGAVPPGVDERLSVLSGAVAVAVLGRLLSPEGPGAGYYQPTVARVGLVVTVSVAAVALAALLRRDRELPTGAWLWAMALLGLPAGWLGPVLSPGLLRSAPGFGRLAQVVLATCVAAVALAWLSRRRPPGLAAAGAAALGTAAGLAAFSLLARAGHLGFTPGPVPTYAWLGIGALTVAGVLAGGFVHSGVLVWAPAAFAAAYAVSVYENTWTLRGWPEPEASLNLALALALPPLAALLLAAPRRGPRAVAVLVVSLGWVGYVALPYIGSWGPVILVLLACGLALHRAAVRKM
jgi:hypothetical protein